MRLCVLVRVCIRPSSAKDRAPSIPRNMKIKAVFTLLSIVPFAELVISIPQMLRQYTVRQTDKDTDPGHCILLRLVPWSRKSKRERERERKREEKGAMGTQGNPG